MPAIRVSQEVYRKIILEAGKRGCTIREAADSLFATLSQSKPEVKQESEDELIKGTIFGRDDFKGNDKEGLNWLEE